MKNNILKLNKKIIFLFLLLITIIVPFTRNEKIIIAKSSDDSSSNLISNADGELKIHVIDLNENGDCIIVERGDIDILIDAGGNEKSGKVIYESLDKYVTDDIIEYCVMTHGDSDHIINFHRGNYSVAKWLNISDKERYIDTLIDFDINSDDTVKNTTFHNKANLYKDKDIQNYTKVRDSLLGRKIKKYFTATECVYKKRKVPLDDIKQNKKNKDKEYINNLSDEFIISNDLKIKILYNYFYDHSNNQDDNEPLEAVDKNNISVCMYIESHGEKFLFTGDLEQYDSSKSYKSVEGESKLIEYNPELKDGVLFYKAAHHGSDTSNSKYFMDLIKPQYIAIPCVATKLESSYFKFPSQQALNNMLRWTDYIHITDKRNDEDESIIENYYGDLNYIYDGKDMKFEHEKVFNQNKNSEDVIEAYNESILNTKWFDTYRSFPIEIYNLVASINDENIEYFDSDCTYIKIGHIDIIINCGLTRNIDRMGDCNLVEQIKQLCNDNVIDYLLITDAGENETFTSIVGSSEKHDGLLSDDYFKSIENVIYPDYEKSPEGSNYTKLISSISNNSKIKNKFLNTDISINSDETRGDITLIGFENSMTFVDLIVYDNNKIDKNAAVPYGLFVQSGNYSLSYVNCGNSKDSAKINEYYNSRKFNNKRNINFISQISADGYLFPQDNNDKQQISMIDNFTRKANICLLNGIYSKINYNYKIAKSARDNNQLKNRIYSILDEDSDTFVREVINNGIFIDIKVGAAKSKHEPDSVTQKGEKLLRMNIYDLEKYKNSINKTNLNLSNYNKFEEAKAKSIGELSS